MLEKLKNAEKVTRPDTRPSVADGWAGVEMRVFPLFDSCLRTDGPTDKASYRVACPQLKMIVAKFIVILKRKILFRDEKKGNCGENLHQD